MVRVGEVILGVEEMESSWAGCSEGRRGSGGSRGASSLARALQGGGGGGYKGRGGAGGYKGRRVRERKGRGWEEGEGKREGERWGGRERGRETRVRARPAGREAGLHRERESGCRSERCECVSAQRHKAHATAGSDRTGAARSWRPSSSCCCCCCCRRCRLRQRCAGSWAAASARGSPALAPRFCTSPGRAAQSVRRGACEDAQSACAAAGEWLPLG
eukprot:2401645-Rhodomonas_salina.1